jgi:hypothetical protein
MHQAARLQFERVMDEFVRWHAVPEDERSPAPAWWWGPAMAVFDTPEPMRRAWCRELGLADGSSFADGARMLLALFAEQTTLPWSYDFPHKAEIKDDSVRDLHPRPSDDSAFQP